MARESEFVAFVSELLAPLDGPAEAVRIRRMFGGHGVFIGDTMFALIADDVLYLKVDDDTRADFEDAGCAPFTYKRDGKTRQMSYYAAPDGVLEDADDLRPWAERAIDAAKRNRTR